MIMSNELIEAFQALNERIGEIRKFEIHVYCELNIVQMENNVGKIVPTFHLEVEITNRRSSDSRHPKVWPDAERSPRIQFSLLGDQVQAANVRFIARSIALDFKLDELKEYFVNL